MFLWGPTPCYSYPMELYPGMRRDQQRVWMFADGTGMVSPYEDMDDQTAGEVTTTQWKDSKFKDIQR